MIIDLILERHNKEQYGNFFYSAHDFYFDVNAYAAIDKIGNEICYAMDELQEKDVKQALCNYIDNQQYNPLIKNYINQRTWLTDTNQSKPLVDILG